MNKKKNVDQSRLLKKGMCNVLDVCSFLTFSGFLSAIFVNFQYDFQIDSAFIRREFHEARGKKTA